jgi:hypothetical protein
LKTHWFEDILLNTFESVFKLTKVKFADCDFVPFCREYKLKEQKERQRISEKKLGSKK